MKIDYTDGDATNPIGQGNKIIVHICNYNGGWGKGFVLALSRKWSAPEQHYRGWHKGQGSIPLALGHVQFVQVARDLWVANLMGNTEYGGKGLRHRFDTRQFARDWRASPGKPGTFRPLSTCHGSVAAWLAESGKKLAVSLKKN